MARYSRGKRNFMYINELEVINTTSLDREKTDAKKKAIQLWYDEKCLKDIDAARTPREVTKALSSARERCFA